MKNLNKWARENKDFAELLLAIATIFITIFIAFMQLKLQISQQEINQNQAEKVEFLESVKFLREDRDKDCRFFLDSADIARSTAQKMRDISINYSKWVQNIVQANAKCAINKDGHHDEIIVLQSKEAANRAMVTRESDRWFAVAGSFSVGSKSLDRAKAWAETLKQKTGQCTEVWRTKLSNSYAVVLGTISNQAKALENAAIARSQGNVPDAFTQIDREWIQITKCEEP